MKTLLGAACVVALLVGVSFTPVVGQDAEAGAKTYRLAVKFKQGETRRYSMKQEMTQEMDFGMGPMKTTMLNTSVMADTCSEVLDDGSVVLASKTESIAMKFNNPMFQFEYDSAKPDADVLQQYPMFRGVFALAGETITYTLSADRKVTKIEGLKEIRERASKGVSGEDLETIESSLDEKELRRTMEAVYEAWPKDAVAVGGTWKHSMNVPAGEGMSMKSDLTYKLDGVETRDGVEVALISVTGTMEMAQDGTAPAEMELGTQKIDGKIVFDIEKGETIEGVTKISFDLKVEQMPSPITTVVTSTHQRLGAKAETEEVEDAAGDEADGE